MGERKEWQAERSFGAQAAKDLDEIRITGSGSQLFQCFVVAAYAGKVGEDVGKIRQIALGNADHENDAHAAGAPAQRFAQQGHGDGRAGSAAIRRVRNGDHVIKELLEAAAQIAGLHRQGEALGLTPEEMAFYDALTKPEAVKDFYQNSELVAITRELTEMLRKNRTIDWQKKETARAGMRRMVKRLLKKYKYPPEGVEDALNTVLSQCEMWTDNL